MKNQFVAPIAKTLFAADTGREPNADRVPPETVGRSLGYSENELLFAFDVLDRFDWQRRASQDEETEKEKAGQPGSERDRAA
jgi:hypothetical protein